MMDHDSTVYSQWFKGNSNEVANALSHNQHLLDKQLLNLFLPLIPEQIPNNFRICPLLPDAISRILTWLHSLPPSTQSPKEPQQSKLTTGWGYWQTYHKAIELNDDPFLSTFSQGDQH
jgi:hypothetical protein